MRFTTRELILFLAVLMVPIVSYFVVFKPQSANIEQAKAEITHKREMLSTLRIETARNDDLRAANTEIGERITEHRLGPDDPRLAGDPPEPHAQPRQVPRGDEGLEPPTRIRRFGVDQPHGTQTWVADHRVTGDHAAAVVADDCDLVEFDEVDHAADGLDVLPDRHRSVDVEPAGAG